MSVTLDVASLRDVLNHAGKKVRITGASVREGLAVRRGDTMLLEPNLAPTPGETIEVIETGERFRVVSAEPQQGPTKIDHYKARVTDLPRG